MDAREEFETFHKTINERMTIYRLYLFIFLSN
jgi:hypothetical protein